MDGSSRVIGHLKGIVTEPRKVFVFAYYGWRFLLARAIRRQTGAVYFAPDRPMIVYSIWKICHELGLIMTADPARPHRLAVHWEDATFDKSSPPDPLPPNRPPVNARCMDISKSAVERAMVGAFGYGLAIDPATHVGPYVRKSEENAAHDGVVLDTPTSAEPGYVYQRLADNLIDADRLVDLRIPILGRQLPLVYLRFRSVRERFTQVHKRVEAVPTASAISEDEVVHLRTFADLLGLDFGELDGVRDRTDGRLYIVDANKTPAGPPAHMAFWPGVLATRTIAKAFEAEFLSSQTPP
jgi:hypothetical protein